jgi:hypothetical protein
MVIGLYHPLDGVTNPKYKLPCFLKTIFLQREEGTSFKPRYVLPSSTLFMGDSLTLEQKKNGHKIWAQYYKTFYGRNLRKFLIS